MITVLLIDHMCFLCFEEKIQVWLSHADKRFFEMRILLLVEMSKLWPDFIATGGGGTSRQWQYQRVLVI